MSPGCQLDWTDTSITIVQNAVSTSATIQAGTYSFCYVCDVFPVGSSVPIQFTKEIVLDVFVAVEPCLSFTETTCPQDRCTFMASLNECLPTPPACLTYDATTCP